jgi:sugar O-acyltransferase (sialic acid O-acetyltransferase NeuD family)
MEQKVVNIIGFNGASLAIYSDILLSLGFEGVLNIFKNDDREAGVEYDMGLEYRIFMIDEIPAGLQGEFLICSNNPHTKYFLLDIFKKYIPGLENRLMTLAHPNAYVGRKCELHSGVVIEPGVTVSAYVNLRKGVFIGRGATIGHHNDIDEFSTVNPGATLTGNIKIGEYVQIGPGTTVVSRTTIGSKTVIGAGSVVTKDIPAGVIAYGNPCKVIRENDIWK